ncbi:MAG: SpoIIE family protein phosphatase [Bacteroidales bacterium]
MSLYILTGVFCVFIFIIFYNYQVSKRAILNETKMNANNLTRSTLYQIENMLAPAQKIPVILSHFIETSEFTRDGLEELLQMIVLNNREIFGSCIAFEPYAFNEHISGYAPYAYRDADSVILINLADDQYQYFNWDWYTLPQKAGPGWSEPYFDEGGGNVIMSTYSVPFYWKGGDDRFRGVVTVDISLEELRELIGKLEIYESGFAFLLSGSGVFISHPDSSIVLRENIFSLSAKNNLSDMGTFGMEMITGQEGFWKFHSLQLQKECFIYFTSMPGTQWSMAMVIPVDEILDDLHSLIRRILFIGIAGFLAIFIIIFIISRNITRPLEKLAAATQEIGAGNFDISLPQIFSRDEIGQLSGNFALMQKALKEYISNLREATAAREKIESELKIARDIQQSIIPKTFPPFPQRSDVDIHAVLIPAREVGGDLYDYFFIEDDVLAFAIGDVSGKGVPSSLFMAITRTLFRSRTQKKMKASEIVQEINGNLCIDNENAMFVTFFLGLIDLKSGKLDFCNAGHNYPYLKRKNGHDEFLNITHGTPLGLFENMNYESGSATLAPGDNIVLYTDGVTEAMDGNENLYGEERLRKLLAEKCDQEKTHVRDMTRCIMDDLGEFTGTAGQSDDITILVLSYNG